MVQALRHAADEACRAGFLAAAERELLVPALRLAAAPAVEDIEVAAMEAGVRRLRALEGGGRRLGSAQAYDRAVRDLTAGLAALAARAGGAEGLRPVDLARSIEILAGPEAAQAVLDQAGKPRAGQDSSGTPMGSPLPAR